MLRNLFLLLALFSITAETLANTAADAKNAVLESTETVKLKIHRHSAWSDIPPKGVDAEGIRMNLAPGDSLKFRDLTLSVTQLMAARAEGEPDRVRVTLKHSGTTETRTLDEGAAFNWGGYHVAIVAVYGNKGDLGFGLTVVEVATVKSLPKAVAQSEEANGPEYRLRVKHDINKLTLHHSATTHTLEDDLGGKMRSMQAWGEKERNWFDVPYHFIIDIDGTILEARNYRYAGDTNTRYDTRGHFLINCFGDYNAAEPTKQQLESIAALMAWAAAEFSIEPLKIYGHRDLAQTSCPGDNLYKYVKDGTLKKMVEAILAKGKPELVWVEEKRANMPGK